MKFYTVPIVDDALQTPYDGMAVQVDPQLIRNFIDDQTHDEEEDTDKDDADEDNRKNAEITVNVFNTTDTAELAGRVADALTDDGFTEGVISNAPPEQTTVVRHAADEQDKARRVTQELGGDILTGVDENLSPGEVTVLLADDYDPAQLPAGDGGAAGQSDGDDEPSNDDAGSDQPGSPGEDTADKGSADAEADAITADGIPCVY